MQNMNDTLRASLTERKQKTGKALGLLQETHALFKQFDGESSAIGNHNFAALIKGLESDAVRIVIVGEFSRGKSMLANALLGINLLRSDYGPTTAINTFIHALPADRSESFIRVCFQGQKYPPKEIAWTDEDVLEKWGTELDRENAEARTEVESIEVFTRHELLDLGLVLIDTPGLESMVAHHEEITRTAIAQSHIAIWVQSAEQLGGNAREWQFLSSTLNKNFRKFLTVINKWDLVMDPMDDHEQRKEPAQREAEKLGIVRAQFKKNFSNMSERDIQELTSADNLMGVSAAWALHKTDTTKHAKSGVAKLAARVAALCNTGEAHQEIFYKPLKQLSSMQESLQGQLNDVLLTLNDTASLEDKKRDLSSFEADLKNMAQEQQIISNAADMEHQRIGSITVKELQENITQPLKTLKEAIDVKLTLLYVQQEMAKGNRNISLPKQLEAEFKQTSEQVATAWEAQKKTLDKRLGDLRADYVKEMQQSAKGLTTSLNGMQIQIPSLEIKVECDFSAIEEHQAKKMEIEAKQREAQEKIEALEQEQLRNYIDPAILQQAKAELTRAERSLDRLGTQPSPLQKREEYKDPDRWAITNFFCGEKYLSRTVYDHSNVHAYNSEKEKIHTKLESKADYVNKVLAENSAKDERRMSAEMAQRKAEKKYAELEKRARDEEAEAKQRTEAAAQEALAQIKQATSISLEQRIRFLETDASKMIETMFTDQLTALKACVEEQFNEPLRAKQKNREETIKLIEEGEHAIQARKNEVEQAQQSLSRLQQETKAALGVH